MKKRKQKFTNIKKRNSKIKVKTIFKKKIQYQSGDFFEVEQVLDRRGTDEDPFYYIKWKNWGHETNTWEPAKNLKNCKQLVYEYEKNKNPNVVLDFLDTHFENTGSISMDSEPDGDIHRDMPEKILRMHQDEDGNIWALIKWMIRVETGVRPNNTIVQRDELKENYILLLLEYYETKIKFF